MKAMTSDYGYARKTRLGRQAVVTACVVFLLMLAGALDAQLSYASQYVAGVSRVAGSHFAASGPTDAPGRAAAQATPAAVRKRFAASGEFATPDPNATVLLYDGNESSPDVEGNGTYGELEAATGRTVQVGYALPETPEGEHELDQNACTILQLNSEAFSSTQEDVLRRYMQQGGVVIATGEYNEYDPSANESLNTLASSLGVAMAFQENALNGGFHVTTEIGSTPYSQGVSSLEYAAVAGLNVGAPAQTIASLQVEEETGEEGGFEEETGEEGGFEEEEFFAQARRGNRAGVRRRHRLGADLRVRRADDGPSVPFIGVQAIGHGAFVMLGDSDVLSDDSGDGYLSAGNGVLANDLCGGEHELSRAWPTGGYGYKFQNKGMNEFASGASLRPPSILRPSDLEATFADWNYNPVISGSIAEFAQEELEILTGWGPLAHWWKEMEGGTCYGLALSGGRFDDGDEELLSPANGRSNSTWNVGSGPPSASTLLPEPNTKSPKEYDEQFLRLDADDFLTQFSTEVLNSFKQQQAAYADGTSGVTALREQLESIMSDGTDLYDTSGRLDGTPGTGLAMLSLEASDGHNYGHEILAYSLDVLPDEILKIGVWDNNFPGHPYYVLVYPDGTWSYLDAPYPESGGYRYFGTTYSMDGTPGYAVGHLMALPLYTPKGLHVYPSAGSNASIVDVDADTTVASALASDGTQPTTQFTIAGSIGYAGETLSFDSPEGELSLEGSEPSVGVRGAGVYMSAAASGHTKITENTDSGAIGSSGSPATLAVARDDLLITSTGAQALTVPDIGGVSFTADASGHATVEVEFDAAGALATATVYSGPTTPGEVLSFTPGQVSEAEGLGGETGGTGGTSGGTGGTGGGGTSTGAGAGSGGVGGSTTQGSGGVAGISTAKSQASRLSGHLKTSSASVLVPLSCPAASGDCAALTIRLAVVERLKGSHLVGVAASRTVTRVVVLGHLTVTLPAGQHETVRIPLNSLGRMLLARYKSLQVNVVIGSEGVPIVSQRVRFIEPRRKG